MPGINSWLYDRTAVGPSQWRPFASMAPTAAPAAPSGPVQSAYEAMFSGADDDGGGYGAGVSSGVSRGVSGGTSPGTSPGSRSGMTTTQSPSYNNNLASIGGKVGRAAGMLTGVGALGFVGGAVGLGLDAYNANQELAEHQTPALGFGDVASAALNNATFGLAGQDINAAKAANYIDYWGPGGYDGGFAGPPVGWDAFGGFEEAYGYGDFTGTDETGGGWGADPSQTGFDESYGYGSFDGMDETGGGWGDGSDSSDSSGGGGGGNGTGGTGSGTSGGAGSDDDDW